MSMVQPIRDKGTIRNIITYLNEKNPRDCLMFMIGIYTGLRISDILRLKVRDVYQKNEIYITEKKTGHKKAIIFHKELKRAAEKYCRDKDQFDYLIKSRENYNKPISRTQAYRILQDVAEKFDLNCIGTHTLRKSYGYHLYMENDKDVVLVQKALNHSHPSITLHYIGAEQDRVYKATLNLSYY